MASGVIYQPAFQRPTGKLKLTGNQLNLVDGVATPVELDQIPAGYTDGIENVGTYRITPGVPGFYAIVGQTQFFNVVVNKNYILAVYVNLVGITQFYGHSAVAAPVSCICVLPCHYLAAGDYVHMKALSDSGDNTVDLSATYTTLSVQRVR